MLFTRHELEFYQRQFTLDEVGVGGQNKLRKLSVLVIGAGGLGCPVLLYLAGAGVGTLGIADHDIVQTGNLHRQILYTTEDTGKSKAGTAAETLRKHNPYVHIDAIPEKIDEGNAAQILSSYNIVVDCTDNSSTRYVVDDVCRNLAKPLISGAVHKFTGQVAVYNYNGSPSYRSLFPNQNPNILNCSIEGTIGATCGVIGSFMAMEVIKIGLGTGISLSGELLQVDLLTMEMIRIKI